MFINFIEKIGSQEHNGTYAPYDWYKLHYQHCIQRGELPIMSASIDSHAASAFYTFGEHSYVDARGHYHYPERIAIGSHVTLSGYFWMKLLHPLLGHKPRIIIGDGCECEEGLILSALNRIAIERNVIIGPHVYISDTEAEYRQAGKPLAEEELEDAIGEVYIEEDVHIGANSVIIGPVRIGRGSTVLPGSVVQEDIPERCVVGGSPARILQLYEPVRNEWVTIGVATEEEQSPEENPLLSICIPTYNRSSNLDRCLHAITSQLDKQTSVEILISDNASTDDTPEVFRRYALRYPYLKYSRNEENMGADRNIHLVMHLAKGIFIKMQGDDDYCVEGSLMPLLDVVNNNRDCGIIHIHVHNNDRRIYKAQGASAFLHASTIMSTFISGMIVRREDLEQIEQPDRFLDSSFNQMYVQYSILMNNPSFCVVNWAMFHYEGNPPGGYNFGEVVFRSYQSILNYFVGKGLTAEDVRAEKKRSLFSYILPWYRGIMANRYLTDTNNFEEIYSEHFAEEPYYEEVLLEIRAITTAAQLS